MNLWGLSVVSVFHLHFFLLLFQMFMLSQLWMHFDKMITIQKVTSSKIDTPFKNFIEWAFWIICSFFVLNPHRLRINNIENRSFTQVFSINIKGQNYFLFSFKQHNILCKKSLSSSFRFWWWSFEFVFPDKRPLVTLFFFWQNCFFQNRFWRRNDNNVHLVVVVRLNVSDSSGWSEASMEHDIDSK